ncbi:MAG: hypothetical protein J6K31_05055 [Parabacteroides sp.]|nr:hypothetical protein [Parabacteroides sp.]
MNEERDLTEELTVRYIAENYTPVGESDKKDYITSADIVRELSEMVTISIQEVTLLMDKAGFKTEFIEGKPHWAIYEK